MLHEESDGGLDTELLEHAQRVVRERIRELRGRADMTQEDAAGRLGRNQPYWSRIENGPIALRLDHLLEVQAALRLDSIEALFGTLPSQRVGRSEDAAGRLRPRPA